MIRHFRLFCLLVTAAMAFSTSPLLAQGISGQIVDSKSEPIPYANIYIQEIGTGTSSDEVGKYYLTLDNRGDFRVIISAIGYKTAVDTIFLGDDMLNKNFTLQESAAELEEIVVTASKKDPAYAIMRKVADKKKVYLKSLKSYRAQVYVKAREDVERFEKDKKKKKHKGKKSETLSTDPNDPLAHLDLFDQKKIAQEKLLGSLNMVEMQVQLNYQYPNRYKEERLAFKKYGSQDGLFIPLLGEADFNFYHNQVDFSNLTELRIISPLSKTAILSYKFKLEETTIEGDLTVYRIKITPRKVGNATVSGELFINKDLWNINRLDFKFSKGGLKTFDALSIQQTYEAINDSTWLPVRQAFIYSTKQGKKGKYDGQTTLRYKDFEVDYKFSEKFFGNEIASTTADAYKRDSSYWKKIRVEPLTEKESSVVKIRDSIETVITSKEYLDSIQADFNRVTFMDIIWDGIGFRDHEKRQQITFGSLPSFIDFAVIGGFRLGPYIDFRKGWENGKLIYTNISANIGLNNLDLQGDWFFFHRYNPHRLGDVWFSLGRSFNNINSFDAYLNQLQSSNWILNDAVYFNHRIEVFNGLYSGIRLNYADRQSASEYKGSSWIDAVLGDQPAIDFSPYQSFITTLSLSYTPKQKYLTEPNRKVVLGSKWPTFTFSYKKGWNNLLSGDTNFGFIDLTTRQNIEWGAIGNSNYWVQIGTFTNTQDLRFIDVKRFRESDPILFSEPLNSFQLLDTSLISRKPFIEFHLNHHFNGALINNIPIVKKTNVRVVAGGGFLYVQESKIRHEEIFAGLERVFKLGVRRRLRLGVYGVLANSNYNGIDQTFKVGIDIIDTWKKDWSY